MEKKNAEFKYKALFLAKVAHEFKNPLICISELIEKSIEVFQQFQLEFQSCDNSHDKINKDSKGIQENLKLINSFSKFLIILTKDLDYFSGSQLEGNNQMTYDETNLDDVLDFVQDVTKGLIMKF